MASRVKALIYGTSGAVVLSLSGWGVAVAASDSSGVRIAAPTTTIPGQIAPGWQETPLSVGGIPAGPHGVPTTLPGKSMKFSDAPPSSTSCPTPVTNDRMIVTYNGSAPSGGIKWTNQVQFVSPDNQDVVSVYAGYNIDSPSQGLEETLVLPMDPCSDPSASARPERTEAMDPSGSGALHVLSLTPKDEVVLQSPSGKDYFLRYNSQTLSMQP